MFWRLPIVAFAIVIMFAIVHGKSFGPLPLSIVIVGLIVNCDCLQLFLIDCLSAFTFCDCMFWGCHCDCCDVVVGGLCACVFLVVWDVVPIYCYF